MSDSSANSDAPPANSSSAPSQPDQADQGLSFRVSGVATSTLPGEHEHQQQPQSESIPHQQPTANQKKRPTTSTPVVLKTNKSIVKGLVKPGAAKAGKQAKPGEQSQLPAGSDRLCLALFCSSLLCLPVCKRLFREAPKYIQCMKNLSLAAASLLPHVPLMWCQGEAMVGMCFGSIPRALL